MKINYCKCYLVVCDYVACSVGLRPDAWAMDKNTCISNIAIQILNAARSGDQFFCGWGRNLWFRNRTRKKVYRRQKGERVGEYLDEHTMMDGDKNCLDFWFDILCNQRCWCKNIFHVHKNGRRDVTRRYCLGNVQSEDMFINGMGFWGNIFRCIHAARNGDRFFRRTK